MAKNRNVDVDAMENHQLQAGSEIGVVSTATMANVELITNNPTLVPGKNWPEGVTIGGTYLDTNRIYSQKFTAGKEDAQGRIYRDLHNLRDDRGNEFGIWSVGTLGAFFGRCPANAKVAIKYLGLAEAPLKAGQSRPHAFEFKLAEGVRLMSRAVDADAPVALDDAPPARGPLADAPSYAN